MKKIEDYAHLYKGCEVKATHPYDCEQFAVGRITGTSGLGSVEIQFVIDGNSLEIPYDVPFAEVKLILRPLSDIAEEEALHLAGIYSGDEKLERTRGVSSNWFYFKCFKETHPQTLVISESGEAWYTHYFDKTMGSGYNIVNSHEATRYMLSKGFDLFHLIPDGLAIDKTTLKP